MAQGAEPIEAALQAVQHAADGLAQLDGLDAAWKAGAAAKLAGAAALLRATADRFFVKTKAGAPFVRRCQEEADRVAALVQEASASPTPGAPQQLGLAVDALNKAARTLDERSQMQGLAIT